MGGARKIIRRCLGLGGACQGIGWCLGDACEEIGWYLRDAGEGILVIAALFFVLSGSFGCSVWISSVHQMSQISNHSLLDVCYLIGPLWSVAIIIGGTHGRLWYPRILDAR